VGRGPVRDTVVGTKRRLIVAVGRWGLGSGGSRDSDSNLNRITDQRSLAHLPAAHLPTGNRRRPRPVPCVLVGTDHGLQPVRRRGDVQRHQERCAPVTALPSRRPSDQSGPGARRRCTGMVCSAQRGNRGRRQSPQRTRVDVAQPAVAVLRDLTSGKLPLTHEALDSLPQKASIIHLRDLLIASGALADTPASSGSSARSEIRPHHCSMRRTPASSRPSGPGGCSTVCASESNSARKRTRQSRTARISSERRPASLLGSVVVIVRSLFARKLTSTSGSEGRSKHRS